jgi:hypothetical protein
MLHSIDKSSFVLLFGRGEGENAFSSFPPWRGSTFIGVKVFMGKEKHPEGEFSRGESFDS